MLSVSLLLFSFLGAAASDATDLKTFVGSSVLFRRDGKINISSQVKHIKLDIGLSYNAPMSQEWLTREEDLLVFGFEPNSSSVAEILRGAIKKEPHHGAPLETRFIGKEFFLIPCALGLSTQSTIPFFITQNDPGCSSMYCPNDFSVERIIDVPIFSLENFFDLFPFDTHPVIDYIKIDAQGADLDIAKSAGHYLAERVAYITLEPENSQYEGTNNSTKAIQEYMESIGFVRHFSPDTSDPTYVNPRFAEYIKSHNVCIYQKG